MLTDYGMKKEYHRDYNDEIVDEFYEMISDSKRENLKVRTLYLETRMEMILRIHQACIKPFDDIHATFQ